MSAGGLCLPPPPVELVFLCGSGVHCACAAKLGRGLVTGCLCCHGQGVVVQWHSWELSGLSACLLAHPVSSGELCAFQRKAGVDIRTSGVSGTIRRCGTSDPRLPKRTIAEVGVATLSQPCTSSAAGFTHVCGRLLPEAPSTCRCAFEAEHCHVDHSLGIFMPAVLPHCH